MVAYKALYELIKVLLPLFNIYNLPLCIYLYLLLQSLIGVLQWTYKWVRYINKTK
jgi:hypothetical protein